METGQSLQAIDLKILRLRAGLKQYELAARLGIPASALSEIENGRRQPSPELLARMLEIIEGETAR